MNVYRTELPFCFAYETGARGSFSDAGLVCFSRILASNVMLPQVLGLLVAECMNDRDYYSLWKRGTVMTEVTEFENRTHRQQNGLRPQESGWYSEKDVSGVKSFVAHERWGLLRTDCPTILPIPDEIVKTQQISSDKESSAGVDRWGFVYGLLERPTSKDHVINVEPPLDHWSWCGDPALTTRICLKKRMSILNHFGG
jgi:hypothetical protein